MYLSLHTGWCGDRDISLSRSLIDAPVPRARPAAQLSLNEYFLRESKIL